MLKVSSFRSNARTKTLRQKLTKQQITKNSNFYIVFCKSFDPKNNLDIYISQGSVATYIRCGRKHDKCFIADFLLNPTVKEL